MDVIVKLAKGIAGNQVSVTVPSDCSIAELIVEVRRKLPPMLDKCVLARSLKTGSTIFLSSQPEAQRLDETKRLIDYQLTDGCTLWLNCAHVEERHR
jgi:hypothetical protein